MRTYLEGRYETTRKAEKAGEISVGTSNKNDIHGMLGRWVKS